MTDRIDELVAAFMTPGPIRRHPSTMHLLSYVRAPSGRIAYETGGEGVPVLLVHGWQGSPRDFSSLMPALQAAGAKTVALDLPAHGASEGTRVTSNQAADAILAVAQEEGPFAAVIAHSFGCAATSLALTRGLKTQSVVFFAPPTRQRDGLKRFAARHELTDAELAGVIARLEADGIDLDAMDIPKIARDRKEPLLVIHSRDDEMTPFAGAEEVAAAWPGAKLLDAIDLGHNNTMRDRAMIAATLRFTLGA